MFHLPHGNHFNCLILSSTPSLTNSPPFSASPTLLNWGKMRLKHNVFLDPILLPRLNNTEGGHRNSHCLSKMKVILHQSLPKFIQHVHTTEKVCIFIFIKSGKNYCHVNHFSFQASIHICLCLFHKSMKVSWCHMLS